LRTRLNNINKTSLSDMTIDEVKDITTTLTSILSQQDRITQLRQGQFEREVLSRVEEIRVNIESMMKKEEEIRKRKGLPKAKSPEAQAASAFMSLKKGVKGLGQLDAKWFASSSVLAQIMDGLKGKDGPIMKYVIAELRNASYNREVEVTKRTVHQFNEWLKESKVKMTNFDSMKPKHTVEYEIDLASGTSTDTVRLNKNQRISLYLHSKNADNLRHLLNGGFVMRSHMERQDVFKPSYEQLLGILGDMTADEIAVANKMSEIYDGDIKEMLNETSMRLNGFDIATVENYFRIMTSKLHSTYGDEKFWDTKTPSSMDKMNKFSAEALGFIQPRTEGAENALVLDDAMNVFLQSVSDTRRYYGHAEALRNVKAVMNGRDKNGNKLVTTVAKKFDVAKAPKKTRGTKQPMSYWGAIENLIADMESGQHTPGNLHSWFLNNHARAVLGANLKTIFIQRLSYLTAKEELPMKHWLKGNVMSATYKKMAQYSNMLWSRSQGLMSINMGDAMLTSNSVGKLGNWSMKGIQKMDEWTIGSIWMACESWVKEERPDLLDTNIFKYEATDSDGTLRRGRMEAESEEAVHYALQEQGYKPTDIKREKTVKSEEFYREVAKRTEYIVAETQPTFETVDRAMAARSKNPLMRDVMRFSSQPTKEFGAFVKKVAKVAQDPTPANVAEAGRFFVVQMLLKTFLFALMSAGTEAWRSGLKKALGISPQGDDEDEDVGAMMQIMTRALELTPSHGIMYGGKAVSLIWQLVAVALRETADIDIGGAYEINDPLIKQAGDSIEVMKAWANWLKKYDYEVDESDEDRLKYKTAQGTQGLFGLPLKNGLDIYYSIILAMQKAREQYGTDMRTDNGALYKELELLRGQDLTPTTEDGLRNYTENNIEQMYQDYLDSSLDDSEKAKIRKQMKLIKQSLKDK